MTTPPGNQLHETESSNEATLKVAREAFEKEYILAVLALCAWRVPAAAETLGLTKTSLYRKMRHYSIPLEKPADSQTA